LAVILLAALTLATCSSCFPRSGPREIELEGVDDEGGSPEPAADAGSGEPAADSAETDSGGSAGGADSGTS
jgi:hypothetical protein